MKAIKRKIDSLTKCYAVSRFNIGGDDCLVVAAEKQDACNVYNLDGVKKSIIWNDPGGTMSLVQTDEIEGFFATQKFYSPNDSKEAKIVYVTPANPQMSIDSEKWNIQTVLNFPFLHRFDIIERNGTHYLFMCTIKSDHKYKNDWTSPGKVYATIIPNSLSSENIETQSFDIETIKTGLTKNHGYTRDVHNGVQTAIVCAEEGIFRFTPPENPSAKWEVTQLLNTAASDAIMCDMDGDGEKELLVISPFHGDNISIYKKIAGSYKKVYVYPEPAEFSHAIECAEICGKNYVFIGHREGTRRLLAFYYDSEKTSYDFDVLDENAGAANACFFKKDGKNFLAVTNREINEVALYELIF